MAPVYCAKGRPGGVGGDVVASKGRGRVGLRECRREIGERGIERTKALLGKLASPWQQKQGLPSLSCNYTVSEKGRGKWPSYAAVYAAIAGIAVSLPLYANAVSEENLLYLEAWRAVYQAYYDGTYNGQNWFKLKEKTLKEFSMKTRPETYSAIQSNLSTLDDPYTKLLDPSKYAFITGNKKGGATSGVGLEIAYPKDQSVDGLVVVNTQQGSPAAAAGIQSNDILVQIDETSTKGMSIYEAAGLLKGEKGTTVTAVVRNEGGSVSTYKLEREILSRTNVSSAFCSLEGSNSSSNSSRPAGYIRLGSFSDETDLEVRKAVKAMKSDGASQYVLDMRNNGGGSFNAGVNVARVFINEGVLVNIADNKGIKDYFEAQNAAEDASSPLTVVVNGGTASAAEVLAGALQDNKRATLVGEKTFGKGLIQTLVRLSDGSGVAVSVAKYQTPNGTDINKKGIMPDTVLDEIPSISDDPCTIAKSVLK